MRRPVQPSTVRGTLLALAVLASSAVASTGTAQAPRAAAAVPAPLAVGTIAPDFSLPGATRYGRLVDPVRLSDMRGQTVVIAFFYRARTKG